MNIKRIIKWTFFLALIFYISWKLMYSGNSVLPVNKSRNINLAEEKKSVEQSKYQTNEMTYTCSMHPEIIIDEEGDCPKCGKKLIPKIDY